MPIQRKRTRKPAEKETKKAAQPKKVAVPEQPVTVFMPQQIADKILTAAAGQPKGPISLSMMELLYGKPQLLIVKVVKDGVTNREEFEREMTALNFKVVFLEYNRTIPVPPMTELIQRPKEE